LVEESENSEFVNSELVICSDEQGNKLLQVELVFAGLPKFEKDVSNVHFK
jgi:hypothetical protein